MGIKKVWEVKKKRTGHPLTCESVSARVGVEANPCFLGVDGLASRVAVLAVLVERGRRADLVHRFLLPHATNTVRRVRTGKIYGILV